MRLCGPCNGALRERPGLLECHARGELLNRDGGGIQGNVRVREFVITIVAAEFIAPSIAPSQSGCPVEVDVLGCWWFGGGWGWHVGEDSP